MSVAVEFARLEFWVCEMIRHCDGSPMASEVRVYPYIDSPVYPDHSLISLSLSNATAEYEIVLGFFDRIEYMLSEEGVVEVGETLMEILKIWGIGFRSPVALKNHSVQLSDVAVLQIQELTTNEKLDELCETRMFLDPNTHVITHFTAAPVRVG